MLRLPPSARFVVQLHGCGRAPGPALSVTPCFQDREDGNRKGRGVYSAGNHMQCPVINLMKKKKREGPFSDCIRNSWKAVVPMYLWSLWACFL